MKRSDQSSTFDFATFDRDDTAEWFQSRFIRSMRSVGRQDGHAYLNLLYEVSLGYEKAKYWRQKPIAPPFLSLRINIDPKRNESASLIRFVHPLRCEEKAYSRWAESDIVTQTSCEGPTGSTQRRQSKLTYVCDNGARFRTRQNIVSQIFFSLRCSLFSLPFSLSVPLFGITNFGRWNKDEGNPPRELVRFLIPFFFTPKYNDRSKEFSHIFFSCEIKQQLAQRSYTFVNARFNASIFISNLLITRY